MADVVIYGIKNCNTMKKTFDWLDKNGVAYTFHDYKKQGIDPGVIKRAIDEYGWDKVINTRGMTWRKTDPVVREGMNDKSALEFAAEKTSAIKRPLVVCGDDILLGFDEDTFAKRLKA